MAKRYLKTHGKSNVSDAQMAAYLYDGKPIVKSK